MRPRRENKRPLLPQHARHCPVLEAGNALGFLVYPPLEPNESYYVDYQGDGRYRFVYYLTISGKLEPIFGVEVISPVGGAGLFREEVTFLTPAPLISREVALSKARTLIVPDDMGTPAGGLSLRGAWNFQTPPGWDTVYTPIFNVIERPIPPMLVIRVETDWYAHETEFRYVLQAGEGISAEHNIPIGQVVFVPREEITLRDCSDAEVETIRQFQAEFARDKSATKITTSYGLAYSPHYLRISRSQAQTKGGRPPLRQEEGGDDALIARQSPSVRTPGRNDPCPCGSGKKYKKCHARREVR
jgi:hypothetical protein